MSEKSIKALFFDRDLIAIVKPAGMPAQPDATGDTDALTAAADFLCSSGTAADVYPVHRLDRVVGGVMVIARNARSAAALSAVFACHDIKKRYVAVLDGAAAGGVYENYIYKDARAGKAYVVKNARRGARPASLELSAVSSAEGRRGEILTLADILLHTGRYHQIRVQCASRGTPVLGDGKYGSHENAGAPALFSRSLEFTLSGKKYSFSAVPDCTVYPWSLFSKEISVL